MNVFDIKAAGWDDNQMHWDRSVAIAEAMIRQLPLNTSMSALDFGGGTGILSFILKDYLKEITLMDNSVEMLRVVNEKIRKSGATNLKTVLFDLEHDSFTQKQFDLIYIPMVLHHIKDVEGIINKFSNLLKPKGFLAIADLYKEDGLFHDGAFDGHKGFDMDELKIILENNNFESVFHKQCFVINRQMGGGVIKPYPVFLLTASRKS
jgi:tRNA (cmo5U34)-methyltransferase